MMPTPGFLPSVLALALLAPYPSAAGPGGPDQLVVLGHGPQARPVESLVGELLGRFRPAPENLRPETPATGQGRGLLQGAGLPATSRLVPSPRDAGIRLVDMPLTNPLCLVGTDRASRSWIASNRRRLARLGASCVIVRATSNSEVEAIRRLAYPVPVQSVPIDGLAASLGIRTVPVLIVGREAVRK